MTREKNFCFAFGCLAIASVLIFSVVAFFLPKPSSPAILNNFLDTLQVVLAISCAAVAAIIPGFLSADFKVNMTHYGVIGIRAGGAIAVFVFVFLVDPSSLSKAALDERVSYNEQLSFCRDGTAWRGTSHPPDIGVLLACKQAIKQDPKRYEAYYYIGRYYYIVRDYPEMHDWYLRALQQLTDIGSIGKILETNPAKAELEEYLRLLRGVVLADIGAYYQGRNADLDIARRAMSVILKRLEAFANDDTRLLGDMSDLDAMVDLIVKLSMLRPADPEEWEELRAKWRRSLETGSGPFMWTHYHLACVDAHLLSAQAAIGGPELRKEISESISKFVDEAMSYPHLLETTQKLARCRLLDTNNCDLPWPDGPVPCDLLRKYINYNPLLLKRVRNFLSIGLRSSTSRS